MRIFTPLLIVVLGLSLSSYTYSSKESVKEALTALNTKVSDAKTLEMVYKTSLYYADGTKDTYMCKYIRKADQFYSKNKNLEIIQNAELRLTIDHDNKKMIISNVAAVTQAINLNLERSLNTCVSKTLRDSSGYKKIDLEFDESSSITNIHLVLKNDLPDQMKINFISSQGNSKLDIKYSSCKVNSSVPNSLFDTSKYLKKSNGTFTLKETYKSYNLLNLKTS